MILEALLYFHSRGAALEPFASRYHFLRASSCGGAIAAGRERAGGAGAAAPPSPHAQERAAAALRDGSVNFHFTRKCNFACNFCFHTAKTGGHLPAAKLEAILTSLREAGVAKLNIAGGEPLLFPDSVGGMLRFAKSLGMYTSVRAARARWGEGGGRRGKGLPAKPRPPPPPPTPFVALAGYHQRQQADRHLVGHVRPLAGHAWRELRQRPQLN